MSQELEVKAEVIARTPSLQKGMNRSSMKRCVVACCSLLHRVAACCSVVQSVELIANSKFTEGHKSVNHEKV